MKRRGGATLSPPPPPASPALNCRQLIHIQAGAGPFAGDRLGCVCIEIVHLLRFGGTGFLLSGDRQLADRKPTEVLPGAANSVSFGTVPCAPVLE